MKCSVEVRCIVCQLIFCCGKCRWNHEKGAHGLLFDCPICRGQRFLCNPEELNEHFVKHLTEEHLPLHCRKCDKIFKNMEDLNNIDKCVTISELIDTELVNNGFVKEIDNKFNSLFEKTDEDNYEAIVSVNKNSKTAIITPIVRKKYLVDYESSDSEEEAEVEIEKTPHAKLVPKTPKFKRAATPHVKKLMSLVRQKAMEEYDETVDDNNFNHPTMSETTPSRIENEVVPDVQSEMTTPTSHIQHLAKLSQAVSTSTPTHSATGGWSIFAEQGIDSPLSEIENTGSPAQSLVLVNEPSKAGDNSETAPPKLKSIIVTGSRIRIGSQDSSEKQVTSQDSTEASSIRVKKVKFADDTKFEQEPKVKRVYRKPKRMLTPGPQKPKFSCNPRFRALLNRFENQGFTMARTPVNISRDKSSEVTPIGETALVPARAIDFKEGSPVVSEADESEIFKSCTESPQNPAVNNAITALTANIAGSLQSCLTSVFKPAEHEAETEIQFKFVITKRTVSVKRIVEHVHGIDEKSSEVYRGTGSNKENIWSTVAKAVKSVFWNDQNTPSTSLATTPYRSHGSNDTTSSSASKRKCEEMSDSDSPVNHKRHKYEGRIRGRPPLRRTKTWVSSLRSSQSAEQSLMKESLCQDDVMNQSF